MRARTVRFTFSAAAGVQVVAQELDAARVARLQVRQSNVVAAEGAGLTTEAKMAIARVMGNSIRAWGTNYDVAKAAREAVAGQAAYSVLLLTSAAHQPATQTAVENTGLPWGGGSEPGQAGALVLARPKRARCSLLDDMLQQAAAAKVARTATVAARTAKAEVKAAMKRAQGRPVGWVRFFPFLHSQLCSPAVLVVHASAEPQTHQRRCFETTHPSS